MRMNKSMEKLLFDVPEKRLNQKVHVEIIFLYEQHLHICCHAFSFPRLLLWFKISLSLFFLLLPPLEFLKPFVLLSPYHVTSHHMSYHITSHVSSHHISEAAKTTSRRSCRRSISTALRTLKLTMSQTPSQEHLP